MGTRAIISIDGEPFIATHYDGYPESLGFELSLIDPRDKDKLIMIASRHSIDYAHPSIAKKLNVSSIIDYNDFAEYQYDIDSKTGKIRVREIEGPWKEKKTSEWKPLSEIIKEIVIKSKIRLKKVI